MARLFRKQHEISAALREMYFLNLLQLQAFVLSKERHYLFLDGLFFGRVWCLVSTLYQRLDLLLDLFLPGRGLGVFSDVVLIVH